MVKTRQGNQRQQGRKAKRWEGEETCPRGGISVNFVGTTHKPLRLACVPGTSHPKQDHYPKPPPAPSVALPPRTIPPPRSQPPDVPPSPPPPTPPAAHPACRCGPSPPYLVNVKPHVRLPAVAEKLLILVLVPPHIDAVPRFPGGVKEYHRARRPRSAWRHQQAWPPPTTTTPAAAVVAAAASRPGRAAAVPSMPCGSVGQGCRAAIPLCPPPVAQAAHTQHARTSSANPPRHDSKKQDPRFLSVPYSRQAFNHM